MHWAVNRPSIHLPISQSGSSTVPVYIQPQTSKVSNMTPSHQVSMSKQIKGVFFNKDKTLARTKWVENPRFGLYECICIQPRNKNLNLQLKRKSNTVIESQRWNPYAQRQDQKSRTKWLHFLKSDLTLLSRDLSVKNSKIVFVATVSYTLYICCISTS